jgi:hypothetical protein
VLLYLLGFIIENIYLGSLGITIFDILKARYILIGGLFAFFLAAIGIPTIDVFFYYRNSENISFHQAIYRLLKNLLITFIALFLGSAILEVLAGANNTRPLGIASINPPKPFGFWAQKVFPELIIKSFNTMMVIGLIVVSIIIIILLIVFVINPKKDNKHVTRKERLQEFKADIKKRGFKSILDLLGILAFFFFVLPIVSSFITFLTSNATSTGNSTTSIDFSSVYFRFILAVLACYIVLSLFFIGIIYQGKVMYSGSSNSVPPRLLNKVAGWIYLITFIVVLLLPIYSFGIYPLIPQQIGGGTAIPIEIMMNDSNLQNRLQPPLCQPYIIDRTSSAVLVVCVDVNSYSVVEVQLDQVKSIIFQ